MMPGSDAVEDQGVHPTENVPAPGGIAQHMVYDPTENNASSAAAVSDATRRGVAWSAGSKILIQVLQFGTTVVLARLLTPTDYGLVAIVLAFSGFAYLFTELGLGAAVIHIKDLDQAVLTTAFWLNAGSGFALTALFCGLAYPISLLYGQSKLTWLIIVASFAFSLSVYAVHLALLERAMSFRLIARIELAGAFCNTVVAIGFAVAGAGPYSLVAGLLVQTALISALTWRAVKWAPTGRLSRRALQEIWAFSGNLFGFNVVNYWSRNSDNLLVGKILGAAALGSYARAYNLMMLPVQQVTGVVGRVLFPAYTKLRDDQVRLRAAYVRSVRVMTAISAPVSAALAGSAGPFIVVVYGSRWGSVAPTLTLLALSGPAQVVAGTQGSLYQALGMTASQFRRASVAVAISVAAIVAGLHWGIHGLAVALLIKFWLLMPVTGWPVWGKLGLRTTTLLLPLWPVALASGLIFTSDRYVHHLMQDESSTLTLGVQMLTAMGVYLIVMGCFGRRILYDVLAGVTGRTRGSHARHRFRHQQELSRVVEP